MINSIDQMIESGRYKIAHSEIKAPNLQIASDRAWDKVLQQAKSHLPKVVQPFLSFSPEFIKPLCPPIYLEGFAHFRLIYKSLAPIKVYFTDFPSPTISYEVPAFDGRDGITYWNWDQSETFVYVELALGDASRKFDLFASKFPNLAK